MPPYDFLAASAPAQQLLTDMQAARDETLATAVSLSPVALVQPDTHASTLLAIPSFRGGLKRIELPADTDLGQVVGRRTVNTETLRRIYLADLATGTFVWQFEGDGATPSGEITLTGLGGRPDVTAIVDWDGISSGTTQSQAGQGVRLSPSARIGGEPDALTASRAREAADLTGAVGAVEDRVDSVEAAVDIRLPFALAQASGTEAHERLVRITRKHVLSLTVPPDIDPAQVKVTRMNAATGYQVLVTAKDLGGTDITFNFVQSGVVSAQTDPPQVLKIPRQGGANNSRGIEAHIDWAGFRLNPDKGAGVVISPTGVLTNAAAIKWGGRPSAFGTQAELRAWMMAESWGWIKVLSSTGGIPTGCQVVWPNGVLPTDDGTPGQADAVGGDRVALLAAIDDEGRVIRMTAPHVPSGQLVVKTITYDNAPFGLAKVTFEAL